MSKSAGRFSDIDTWDPPLLQSTNQKLFWLPSLEAIMSDKNNSAEPYMVQCGLVVWLQQGRGENINYQL